MEARAFTTLGYILKQQDALYNYLLWDVDAINIGSS